MITDNLQQTLPVCSLPAASHSRTIVCCASQQDICPVNEDLLCVISFFFFLLNSAGATWMNRPVIFAAGVRSQAEVPCESPVGAPRGTGRQRGGQLCAADGAPASAWREGGRKEAGGGRFQLPSPPTLINSRGGSRVRSSRCRPLGEGRRLRFNGGDPVSTGVGPSPGSSPASWFRLCLLLHFCSVAAVRAVETSPLKGSCVFRHLCSEGI